MYGAALATMKDEREECVVFDPSFLGGLQQVGLPM